MQVLTIRLGKELFGIKTDIVQEINNMVPITTVPNSLNYIRGLMNLRGSVVPVIDIKRYLQILSDIEEKNIVILKIQNQYIGIIVDTVEEVIKAAVESLRIENDTTVINVEGNIITLINEDQFKQMIEI